MANEMHFVPNYYAPGAGSIGRPVDHCATTVVGMPLVQCPYLVLWWCLCLVQCPYLVAI